MLKNVQVEVKGTSLVLTVDISKRLGPSASGKTILIGTTGGNVEIAEGIKVGLTVFTAAEAV